MYLDRDELWVFCHRPFSSAPFIRMKLGLREREWAHRHFLPTADGSAQIGWFALSSRLQTQGGGAEVAGLRPRGRPARRTLLLLAFGSIAGCPTRRSASRNPSFACWVGVAAVIQHVPIQSDFNLEQRKAPLFSFFNDCSVCTNKEEDLNTFMSAFQLSCTSAKELFKKGCFETKELCDAPQPQTPHATPAVHLFGWLGSSKSPSNRWMLSALLAKKHLFCWFRENLPELQTGSFRFLLQLLQLQTFSWKWTILKNTSLKLQIPSDHQPLLFLFFWMQLQTTSWTAFCLKAWRWWPNKVADKTATFRFFRNVASFRDTVGLLLDLQQIQRRWKCGSTFRIFRSFQLQMFPSVSNPTAGSGFSVYYSSY